MIGDTCEIFSPSAQADAADLDEIFLCIIPLLVMPIINVCFLFFNFAYFLRYQ